MWFSFEQFDQSVSCWSCVISSVPSDRSLDSIGRYRQESLSSVEEDDYDTLDDIDSDKNIVRTKVCFLLPASAISDWK